MQKMQPVLVGRGIDSASANISQHKSVKQEYCRLHFHSFIDLGVTLIARVGSKN